MISIGNDIIALQLINVERTKQENFYSKIICLQELELFKSLKTGYLSFDNFVWLAWSIKESVYKFYKRNNYKVAFSPTKIVIQKIELPTKQTFLCFDNLTHENISFKDENCFCCAINFASEVFYTRSILNEDFIFSMANNVNCFKNIYWGIKEIDDASYDHQSKKVREFVLNKLKELFQYKNFNIEKNESGYPILKEKKHLPLSFTHHGKFVGYTFADLNISNLLKVALIRVKASDSILSFELQ